jgi:pilus assembly protein CpaB
MNLRAFVTLIAGVVLSGIAVVLITRELNERGRHATVAAAAPAPQHGNIVVAAYDIGFGMEITRAQLALTPWASPTLPDGSFSRLEDVIGSGKEHRVALRPMVRGEPILSAKVSGFGGRASMSAVVAEDKRAFALRVNDVSGVAGFLLPGDRVDIILTRNPDGGGALDDRESTIILQNVIVRGIDQLADTDRNKPQIVRTVTLEVTPEEAQKLALAMQVGQLSLALRNVAAVEEAKVRTIRVVDLVGAGPKPEAKVAPAAPVATPPRVEPTVRVRRGVTMSLSPIGG